MMVIKPLRKRAFILLPALLAAAALTTSGEQALAATSGTVSATCVSDGYITVSDSGNVQPQPKYYRLIAYYKVSGVWQKQIMKWRPVNGSSYRINAAHGSRYLYAQVATWNGSSYTYEGGWVAVENLTISPIGAISGRSHRSDGFCVT
jgi:hypothetical protein